MNILIVILSLVAAASAKDLIVGDEETTLIFIQNVTASPAIWRQVRSVTVNTTNNEVITRIVVIDNRPDKNGEAAIVDGGVGFKTVTIKMKSPSIFRGLDFQVRVYAELGTVADYDYDQQLPEVQDKMSSPSVIGYIYNGHEDRDKNKTDEMAGDNVRQNPQRDDYARQFGPFSHGNNNKPPLGTLLNPITSDMFYQQMFGLPYSPDRVYGRDDSDSQSPDAPELGEEQLNDLIVMKHFPQRFEKY